VVIDDSPEVLALVARYLAEKNFDTLTSTHGFDLTRLLSRRAPAAVVLDVMLPALSGSTLARIVRKRFPTLPIVFFSAVPEDKGNALLESIANASFVSKAQGLAVLHQAITDRIDARLAAAES
jgi:two-component system, cell cycle sensor histidine kinase and response regulator CckA